jgi:hypothetical protein
VTGIRKLSEFSSEVLAELHIALTIVMQAAKELRAEELLDACLHMDEQNKRPQAWLLTQTSIARHTLVVPQ